MSESEQEKPYSDAIDGYLDAATWLTVLDTPMVVHVRQVARSLDSQLARSGEVQAATASSFTKMMTLLEKRRPAPPPDPNAGQLPGQVSIDDALLGPASE